MRTLVYVGEQIPAEVPFFIKPFQDKETGSQLSWDQVVYLMLTDGVVVRPANEVEMASLRQHADLINACAAYLSQYVSVPEQGEA